MKSPSEKTSSLETQRERVLWNRVFTETIPGVCWDSYTLRSFKAIVGIDLLGIDISEPEPSVLTALVVI